MASLNSAYSSREVNVLLLGDANVGKSSLVRRFLFGTFSEKHQCTVEDMFHKVFLINQQLFEVHFLDTSGSYNFPAMRKLHISRAHAVVIVFSMKDTSSLHSVATSLLQELKEFRGEDVVQKLPLVLVANKMEAIESHELSKEECYKWMQGHGIPDKQLIFTSVLEECGVWSVFNKLWELDAVIRGDDYAIRASMSACTAPIVDGPCPDLTSICSKGVKCAVRNPRFKEEWRLSNSQRVMRRFSAFAVLINGAQSSSNEKSDDHDSLPFHHHHLNQTFAMLLSSQLKRGSFQSSITTPPINTPSNSRKGRLSLGRLIGASTSTKSTLRERPVQVECVMQ